MKESYYQTKIMKRLESEGYYVINLIKTNRNGIADLIAIKENNTIFVEVKTEKGVLSELQKFRLTELTSKGFECYYSNKTELIRWLNEDTIK